MNEAKVKSNTPLLIIGAVLMLAVGGGLWFYSSSKPLKTGVSPTPTPTQQKTIPADAPKGAEPPNQAGGPTAEVTLEEFADFQCPQCGAKHPIMSEIKSTYGSRIRVIYRNYPLPQHDKSYAAAVAAEAAGLQGKFWEMQNLLFSNQQAWTANPAYKGVWKGYAQKIGLNVDKWETDIAGTVAKLRVDADLARVKGVGVGSTPTLYLNGKEVAFPGLNVDSLKRLIDAELQKAAPQSQTAP